MEKQVISELKDIFKTKDVEVVERLMGGMSNYTYVVKVEGKLYTFRIPGEYADNFVSRIDEEKNIKIVDKLDITNKTIYLNTNTGRKVARFVEGTPLSVSRVYPYKKISEILKVIHNSKIKSENDYEPFKRLRSYELLIKELGHIHPFRYLKLRAEYNNYQKYLESQEKVLTHGDSQPSNFVFDGKNLIVVDFEFTGNNDPIYDIACFANIEYSEGLELLKVYYPNYTKDHLKRFILWRCFQCFQWHNVAVFKELKGMSKTLHIDFLKVSEKYLDLAETLLSKVVELEV